MNYLNRNNLMIELDWIGWHADECGRIHSYWDDIDNAEKVYEVNGEKYYDMTFRYALKMPWSWKDKTFKEVRKVIQKVAKNLVYEPEYADIKSITFSKPYLNIEEKKEIFDAAVTVKLTDEDIAEMNE